MIQEAMINYCREDMVNCLDPDFQYVEYAGVKLLISIFRHIPDEMKPCHRKSLGVQNGACVRIGNVNKVISLEEAREFIRNSVPFRFDHLEASNVSIDDLSTDKINSFFTKSAEKAKRDASVLSKVGSFKHLLKNVGICAVFNGVLKPTNAGYLIFATNKPQSHKDYSRYIIRCVHYKGSTPASPIVDKIDLDGTLDSQIEGMQSFILKNIPLSAKVVGTRRVEVYEYPPEAIREIVANAVIHRDYNTVETYTQVSIFSNRIEIINPGNLPPGVTIENLKEAQFSRNINISAILRDMDYMEEYGRGIEIVYAKMSEYGLLSPTFKNSSNSFKVTLLGSEFSKLNERQIQVWQILQEPNRTITTAECISLFKGISRSAISLDLNKMTELNLIEKIGKGSNTHYKVAF